MSVDGIISALFSSSADYSSLFPRLNLLNSAPFRFPVNFGLRRLPEEGGIILIRGARQYGMSTWLEQQALSAVLKLGPGSTAYLNGDELQDRDELLRKIQSLAASMRPDVCKRIFIDEITAIDGWERALKIAADSGELRDVLVVTMGSKATDIRRGEERLPGRKGKLARTNYIFTPVSFSDFKATVGHKFNHGAAYMETKAGPSRSPLSELVVVYLLSGGSPVALTELLTNGEIPEWVVAMTRDWIIGEFSRSGRNRSSLFAVFEQVYKQGMNPLGYTKLARESGLANNTTVAEYIELLTDLMAVAPCYAWDQHKEVIIRRMPAKFHFINLLVAASFSPVRMRSVGQFLALSPPEQAPWLEWLVAQELCRRRAIAGEEQPELMTYWKANDHEIDFVPSPRELWEVKRGQASALEFAWFSHLFPRQQLKVISASTFAARQIEGVTFEAFLENEGATPLPARAYEDR